MSNFGEAVFGKDTFGGTQVADHLPSHFIARVQAASELAKGHQSLRFFKAWIQAEGGTAKWNPLNTTLDMGSQWTEPTDYNSIGVKNYKYAIVGVVATVLTLNQRTSEGGFVYGTLLTNLKDKTLTAEEIVNKSTTDIEHWGTNPTTMLNVLKSIS